MPISMDKQVLLPLQAPGLWIIRGHLPKFSRRVSEEPSCAEDIEQDLFIDFKEVSENYDSR